MIGLRKVAIVVAVLFSTPVFGESLAQLFESALKNDIQLHILALALENRHTAIERGNLDRDLDFDIGTGIGGIVFRQPLTTTGSPALTVDPYVAVSLPEGIETRIEVSADIDFPLADGTEFDLDPVFSVTQPLNSLLGLEASERGKHFADSSSLFHARMAIWSRELEVKKAVIGKVRQVLGLEKSAGDAERALGDARDELDRNRLLGTYSEDSPDFVRLENMLRAAARSGELKTARVLLAMRDLEETLGRSVSEIPREVGPVSLELPQSFDIDRHPAVQTSRLAVESAEIALDEYLEPQIPVYSVGASYAWPAVDSHAIAASVNAGFENLSIGASVSVLLGAASGESLVTAVSVRWALPDNRAKDLLSSELARSLEMARLRHESTIRAISFSMESLRLQIREIEMRRENLTERIGLEERVLQDTAKRFELGAVSESALRTAEWGFEKLNKEVLLLEYEALSVSIDIEGLEYDR